MNLLFMGLENMKSEEIPNNWRIQGSSIRHSIIGKKLTSDEARLIMCKLSENGFSGKYNPETCTIQKIYKEGYTKDSDQLLLELWEEFGSESIRISKQIDAHEIREAIERQRISDENAELDRLKAECLWVDANFYDADINNYNKATFVRFLAGESKRTPLVNWKWAYPLKRIGAIKKDSADFTKVREVYLGSTSKTERHSAL